MFLATIANLYITKLANPLVGHSATTEQPHKGLLFYINSEDISDKL